MTAVSCRHCGRGIEQRENGWASPDADGSDDDPYGCEGNATFTADHAPRDLLDYASGDVIGPATDEQVTAGARSGSYTGVFLVDENGDVVRAGTLDARAPGVRAAWVSPDPTSIPDHRGADGAWCRWSGVSVRAPHRCPACETSS